VLYDERDGAVVCAETRIEELTRELVESTDQSELVVKKWQENSQQLEATISERVDEFQVLYDERDGAVVCAETRIEELTRELVESTDQSELVVKKWQENSQQLEATISELETTLETQHKEANGAISQWEIRCNALSEQVEILEEQVNDDTVTSKMSTLELQLKQKNTELQQNKSKLVDLESSLSQTKIKLTELQDIEAVVSNVKYELCALTESYNKQSEELSRGQEKLRSELLAKAELKMEMRNILQEKEQEIIKLKETKILAQDREGMLNSDEASYELQDKLTNLQSLLDISAAELTRAEELKNTAEKRLQEERIFCSDRTEELEGEKSLLNELIDNHESDALDMKHLIVELEDELLEANDALQSHITDEVSMRATEMATKALRAQLNDLREKHIAEHDAFISEKEARVSAQEEIERMKFDVSLLIQNGDDDGEPIEGQIRKLTSKAAKAIVSKDREEIESLRSSLDHVMQELISCRAKERDAEERAAGFHLHSSVIEEELVAAKSDISFLKQTMNDLNMDSVSTRSSLEDRIKSIDYDRAVLIRSHANERETLKAEVVRGQMERERLKHTLCESEKANSTLVYSTTVQKDADGSSDEIELAKLRLEKAQLLASASENGAKFERRIREAVAANASSIEAEIILEKELRESAELALFEMQRENVELSSCLMNTKKSVGLSSPNKSNIVLISNTMSFDESETDKSKMNASSLNKDSGALFSNTMIIDKSETDELKTTMRDLELEMSQIRNENSALHKKLEEVEEEAITETTRLKNESRLIESKHNETAREEHFEAAVAAEVARLNSEFSPQRKFQNGMIWRFFVSFLMMTIFE